MKTAKINNIDQKPNFRTNDGKTLYVFELTLDNGDVGAIFKQKENAYVQVGDSINYELTERGTIKIQREGGFASNNNQFTKEEKTNIFDAKDRRIAKLSVLKSAVELVCSEKINIEDVQKYADNMLDWVYDKQSTKNLEFTDDKVPF